MHIFTYGTLMFEALWLKVTGSHCTRERAKINGFKRRSVKNNVYPLLIPGEKGDQVDGVVYYYVDKKMLERLDAFEGVAYERREIKVVLPEGKNITAQAYILKKEFYHIIDDREWDKEEFVNNHLQGFLSH